MRTFTNTALYALGETMSDYPDLEFTIVGGKLAQPTKPDETIPMIPNQAVILEDLVIATEVVTTAEVPVSDGTPEVPVTIAETVSAEETSEMAEVSQIDEAVTTDEVSEESISYRQDFIDAVRHAFNMRLVTKQGLCRALSIAPIDEPVADELIKDMVQCSVIQELEGADGVFRTIISTLPEVEESHRRFDEHATASDDDDDDDDSDEVGAIAPPLAPVAVGGSAVVTPVIPPVIPPAAAPVVPRGTNKWKFYVGGVSVLVAIAINLLVLWKFPQNSGFLWIFDFTAILLLIAILNFRLYPASVQWARQQLGYGRTGKITVWALGLVVLIFLIFAVSQLSCEKHQGGAKYGKISSSKTTGTHKGSSTPTKPDSVRVGRMIDSLANLRLSTEAFTAALRVVDRPSDDRMASDADEDDQYNMPHLAWTRMMQEGHAAGQKWDFGDNFYPAARDTVMNWWVASQFSNGESPKSLAAQWLNRVKRLGVPADTANAYGDRLVAEFKLQVTELISDGSFDSWKRSARNTLVPNPEKEKKEKETRDKLGRIVFLLAGLGTSWLFMSSLFGGKKATVPKSIAACAVGAVLFAILGFYPVATMASHFLSTAATVVMMSLVGVAFGFGYLKR